MKSNSTKILIRFDDISTHMNWDVWDKILLILKKHQVKPILAVIPKNEDKSLLKFAKIDDDIFWLKIKEYQSNGFGIAIHGYNHVYTTGDSGLLKFNKRSEFAGVDKKTQDLKIKNSINIFKKNSLNTNLFIAPAHSFDYITLDILKENGIQYISDGFFKSPKRYNTLSVIPKMHWRFKSIHGEIATICFHHNNWGDNELSVFEKNLKKYSKQIIDFEKIQMMKFNDIGVKDIIQLLFFQLRFKIFGYLKKIFS